MQKFKIICSLIVLGIGLNACVNLTPSDLETSTEASSENDDKTTLGDDARIAVETTDQAKAPNSWQAVAPAGPSFPDQEIPPLEYDGD